MEFDEKETDAHLNHSHGTASPNLANANSIISASGVNGKANQNSNLFKQLPFRAARGNELYHLLTEQARTHFYGDSAAVPYDNAQ